jgi:hypothetical protein
VHTDAADRRRIVVATIITIAALPALWLTNRDDANTGNTSIAVVGGAGALEAAGDPSVTAESVQTTPNAAQPDASVDETPIDPFMPADPVYLAGSSLAPPPAPSVVYADPGPTRQYTGEATFRRWGPEWGAQACQSPVAPANARLLVTNVNNGRTTTCTNVLTRPLSDGTILVLDTEAFLQIANLVDAPLPVQISW